MLKTILSILAGLYALSPVDLLPESVIGWLGWIDDLVVLFLLWRFFYAVRQPPDRGWNRPRPQSGETGTDPDAGTTKAPWDVLGVAPDADPETIKQAYKRLAAQYHPDRVHHLAAEFRELAEKRFKEIQAAYDAIRRR